MPEQPPPTTRIRRLHSGFPSSSRKSSTFLAAVSVSVIIRASLDSSVMATWLIDAFIITEMQGRKRSLGLGATRRSENTPGRQKRHLLECRIRLHADDGQSGLGDLLGPQHELSVGRMGNGIPQRGV